MERVCVGQAKEIFEKVREYLEAHPASYYGNVESLLELIYMTYTECNSVETPVFKTVVNPLDEKLRSLADTDEEADSYMNIVFELCAAYERQSYIEGMKTGMRLMLELAE